MRVYVLRGESVSVCVYIVFLKKNQGNIYIEIPLFATQYPLNPNMSVYKFLVFYNALSSLLLGQFNPSFVFRLIILSVVDDVYVDSEAPVAVVNSLIL